MKGKFLFILLLFFVSNEMNMVFGQGALTLQHRTKIKKQREIPSDRFLKIQTADSIYYDKKIISVNDSVIMVINSEMDSTLIRINDIITIKKPWFNTRGSDGIIYVGGYTLFFSAAVMLFSGNLSSYGNDNPDFYPIIGLSAGSGLFLVFFGSRKKTFDMKNKWMFIKD